MPKLTVIFGDQIQQTDVESGTLPGDAIAELELPLEQPCAGAASFLSDEGYARAIRIVEKAEQVDLDADPEFIDRYVQGVTVGAEQE